MPAPSVPADRKAHRSAKHRVVLHLRDRAIETSFGSIVAPVCRDSVPQRRARAVEALLGSFVIAAALASCAAKRELVVISDPPGAIVRLDERIVGMTPYRHPFDDYGKRRLTLYRTGYRSLSEVVKLKPPWYAYFPLDYISEVLIPVGWHDTHEFRFTLEPDTKPMVEPDVQPVLERAERLRRAGPEGPEPPKPPKPKPEPPPE